MVQNLSRLVCALALGAFTLVGCSKSKEEAGSKPTNQEPAETSDVVGPDAPALPAKLQWYRAELQLSGKDSPGPVHFFLQVPQGGAEGHVILRTGEHDQHAEHRWEGRKLVIPFPLFHTNLLATRGADGVLTGTFESASPTWGKATMTFTGTPIDKPEIAALRTPEYRDKPTAQFSGVWKLAMADGSTRLTLTVKPDGAAVGAFSFPSGAHLHIGGIAAGNKVRLSGFDGTSAYLVTGTVTDNTLAINWAAGQKLDWREQFQGERVDELDMKTGPRLIQGADNLDIADYDVSVLEGKPAIVELAGSWCITCKYMTPFLVRMYDKYHPQGLEMVTLTYEFTSDEAYNKKAADSFKHDYGIKWDVIPMMGGLDDAAEILPLTMEGMELGAFPFSIFLDPTGKVQYIYAGFPANGSAEYEPAMAEYEKHIVALLETAKKQTGKKAKKK